MIAFLNTKYRSLLIGAVSLVLLPVAFQAIGLTLDAATVVVILAMAAMGLNLLVGYTGLVSFGHAAWFGIGGYAAALSQLHWFKGQMFLPFAFSILFTAALSLIVGLLILRRRGVYFSLLTLALCALTFATAFRWTSLTGGEGGLGGIERGSLGPLNLDDHLTYYALVAVITLVVVYALQRVVRSPFGHVLVAIRENQQRATFQGYDTDKYKLLAFVLSATVTGLAGALEVAGPIGQLTPYVPAGYGFAAIIVAFVGRLHPVGMVFSAILMSMFYIGGELAQSRLGLPKSLTGVFQGLLLFTLLACDTLIAYRIRWVGSKKGGV